MDLLNRTCVTAALAALLAGCSSTVEVQTTPMDITVPVLSLGEDTYVEVAIDLPPHPQGDITIEQLLGDLKVVNLSGATTMTFSLRLSTEGTAEPDVPAAYTQLNLPAYFSQATVLLAPQAYAPGTTTSRQITESEPLVEAIQNPRIYIIVGNKITNLGLGDALPAELQLQDLSFNVLVTKGFGSVGGALELTGL